MHYNFAHTSTSTKKKAESLQLGSKMVNNPGIYRYELKGELEKMFVVPVSEATICTTLRYTGCTGQAMHCEEI